MLSEFYFSNWNLVTNERENVEYIEREESDGEYDEFGRKKKKYRGKAVGPASILKEVEDKESGGGGGR